MHTVEMEEPAKDQAPTLEEQLEDERTYCVHAKFGTNILKMTQRYSQSTRRWIMLNICETYTGRITTSYQTD